MSSVSSGSESEREREEEVYSSSSEDEGDVQNKRIKLAKEYLSGLDGEDVETTLESNLLEKSNKMNKFISANLNIKTVRSIKHKSPLTHAIISFTSTTPILVFSAKDNNLYTQPLNSKDRHRLPTRHPLCLATSPDFNWLAVGTSINTIDIYNTQTSPFSLITTIPGFKDSITSLSFRKSTPTALFAASLDRSIKIYSFPPSPPDPPSYVETLFGHQDSIYSVDVLRSDLALSVGCRDKSARYWKVVDESQLVFRGGGRSKIRDMIDGALDFDAQGMDVDGEPIRRGKQAGFVEGSLDVCAMIDEQHFLTGGDSGFISLWNIGKKKAIYTSYLAHGVHHHHSETEGVIKQPRGITALAAFPYSDLFASGSSDGYIRLWRIDANLKAFSKLAEIDAKGFVNSIQLVQEEQEKDQLVLVAATAQEPRMGRWEKLPSSAAKNAIVVAHLTHQKNSTQSSL
ncbi:hypothetical protein J056_004169 [Wallemia ichthyophaga EXF-994]|uniref:WD40 repeat-like protein n=1 Tax=Wallemia ichthyophaga (strain EXF-994 / CBS 113033) TaxID=1299270 RepID=R9AGQ7_WALI9|nr:uncharacterized protein J056_004169 [Wallemia ichthyophaga EXF-994]EOR01383.1 hypothetical protein J056_004169 [Wallemia ichthyophaga EXF-994]